ncbi:MAG: hypothetical protein ABIJ61_12790 [bacterium]
MKIRARHFALVLAALLYFATGLQALGLADKYADGFEVSFEVERNGELIGTQLARCTGIHTEGADSLLHFELESTTRLAQGSRAVNLEITSEVDYYFDARPVLYRYTIDALGRKVIHQGAFSGMGYSGNTDRFGVKFPVSQPSRHWALLLDSHFALQWEIAALAFRIAPGDSAFFAAMIPQADTLVLLTVKGLPREQMVFAGDTLVVQVLQVDPVNQVFYVDSQGRLLKAYDAAQRTTVRRLPAGERAELPGESFFASFYDRVPGYGILLLFAAVWYLLLTRREALRPRTWLMLLLGFVIGWPLLLIVMPELAIQYERMLASPDIPSVGTYLVVAGLALMFALIEEGSKLLVLWLRQRNFSKLPLSASVALGAGFGVGFAFLQAAHLTNFAADGSLLQAADLWQRFFLTGISALTGALLALFLYTKRAFWFFLIPFGIKAFSSWVFVFVQQGGMKMGLYYFLLGLICLFTALLFIWLYLSALRRVPAGSRQRKR